MALLDRVVSNVHACGIEIATVGNALPSNITGWQPFYNSLFEAADFVPANTTFASVFFDEESVSSTAGTSFKQRAVFSFPEHDAQRSERIAFLFKIKFVKFKFTSGRDLVIGRNDFEQNTLPTITVKSNGNMCFVTVESVSISPAGFTPRIDAFGLPTFVPLTLVL